MVFVKSCLPFNVADAIASSPAESVTYATGATHGFVADLVGVYVWHTFLTGSDAGRVSRTVLKTRVLYRGLVVETTPVDLLCWSPCVEFEFVVVF